jgi:hypothetical protein
MAICNPVLKNCEKQINNPTGYTNTVVQSVFSIFFIVAVIWFVWHFMMSGYHMINNQGDPKRIETSRIEMINAVLGLGIVFAVFAILKFIGYVLGIQDLEKLVITWPTLS